jgi:hypothetical protein
MSLLGLGYWLWRRKAEDQFSLVWFAVVYCIFTFIPNKDWRYMTPVFPILAIATSDLILFMWDKVKDGLKDYKIRMRRTSIPQFAAAVFVVLIGTSFVFGWGDAYSLVSFEHAHVYVKETSQYVIENSTVDESTVVLFPDNFFNEEMVHFYLLLYNSSDRVVWSYPKEPTDAYSPTLNETWLIEQCESKNVKFLLLYEHDNKTYFESDWRAYYVFDRLVLSGRFKFEWAFGTFPRRIIIIRFLQEEAYGAEKQWADVNLP